MSATENATATCHSPFIQRLGNFHPPLPLEDYPLVIIPQWETCFTMQLISLVGILLVGPYSNYLKAGDHPMTMYHILSFNAEHRQQQASNHRDASSYSQSHTSP